MNSAAPLSEAEKEIMEIIWDRGGKIYIAELLEELEGGAHGWKRTTVRTFVQRLIEKGYLAAERRGKLCEYRARITREEYLSEQARDFVDHMFGGNVGGMLASLFGRRRPGAEELRQLQEFWDRGKEGME